MDVKFGENNRPNYMIIANFSKTMGCELVRIKHNFGQINSSSRLHD